MRSIADRQNAIIQTQLINNMRLIGDEYVWVRKTEQDLLDMGYLFTTKQVSHSLFLYIINLSKEQLIRNRDLKEDKSAWSDKAAADMRELGYDMSKDQMSEIIKLIVWIRKQK